jgi:hypothetical protein
MDALQVPDPPQAAFPHPEEPVEQTIRVWYASIGSVGLGRLIGRLMESIPIRIGVAKLSYFVFGPILAPLGAVLYLGLKLFGERFRLTTHSVRRESALTGDAIASIPLETVDVIERRDRPGYRFYSAADLVLRSFDGRATLKLKGVPRPDLVEQMLLSARDAKRQTDAAEARIRARH